ncbi:MAG: tetratricopeptide repeat protein, partial [Desulfobacteraceae bacterium]|nr:tetratricopeptide repeat protein [Desulfobacteraceae bacterium]
ALFALHPFHVESVAWVSERKDLLSTFFWMLTMWGYVRYVDRPGANRYWLVLLLFFLGMMAKPMLVTLPFVLLLLDYWPLGRFGFGQSGNVFSRSEQRALALRLVREKVPFFIIAAAASILAYFAQQSGGAIGSLDRYPLYVRIANALVSYVGYIGKMIWPHDLSVFYPHPGAIPIWQAAGAGLLLVCVTVMIVRAARRYPYLAVGWFWFLGTLVPVSGLVQVGSHSMADRYTYVPFIGLFILVAWGAPEFAARLRQGRTVLAILVGVALSGFMTVTILQVRHWQNSMTLFRHALEVTSKNVKAHNNLGTAMLAQGRVNEAATHFFKALEISPQSAVLHYNAGLALLRQEKYKEAFAQYFEALRINPNLLKAHRDLGNALLSRGRLDEAIIHLSAVVRINTGDAEAHNNLGNALSHRGRLHEAISHYSEALRIKRDFTEAHYNLGNALLNAGRLNEAISHFAESLRIKPYNAMAHNNMGNALARQGNLSEAFSHYVEALRIKPGFVDVHMNIGIVLKRQGKFDEAVSHFREVLRTQPDNEKARRNLEESQKLIGKPAGAPKRKETP